MTGIASRYVASVWLRMLLLCQGGFIAIYLVLDLMDKIGRFMKAGASTVSVIQFFVFKMPEMIGQTMPFAVLMATLLALGQLSRNSELTALRSCGMGIPRIVAPILFLSLACSLLMLFNSEFLIPRSYERMEHIEKVVIKKQGIDTVFRLNNIWFRSNNLILQAKVFDPLTVKLKGIVVWELSPRMEPLRRMDAVSAYADPPGWVLEKVSTRNFVAAPVLSKAEKVGIPMALKVDDLRVLDNNADNYSFRKLRSYARSIERGGYNPARYLTMMHSKLAQPLACFVMLLLAIPFALKTGRSGGAARGVATGVAIGFAYFIINTAVQSYGRSGILPPVVAAWGANFIFIMAGIWLAMTVKEQ